MKATIVYYTNCLAPKQLIDRTLSEAMAVACKNDWKLIVSSHLPLFEETIDCRVDFHHLVNDEPDPDILAYLDSWSGRRRSIPDECVQNYVTGILSYSSETILTQIVHAIDMAGDTDAVLLWEHDVLYPPDYAERMVESIRKGNDFAVYSDHMFMDDEGFFKHGTHFWHLSRYGGTPQAMKSHFELKIALGNYSLLEPVPRGQETGEESESDIIDSFEILEGSPVVDIKHGSNASGQILVDGHFDEFPGWGLFSDFEYLVNEKEYVDFVNSKPEMGYGLFTISGFFLR